MAQMALLSQARHHPLSARAKHAALAVGNFFYGDETRTRRSITFAYVCIGFYLIGIIQTGNFTSCSY